MKAARRSDWYIHYEICRMRGDEKKAAQYARALRGKYKTAGREIRKIDRRVEAKLAARQGVEK